MDKLANIDMFNKISSATHDEGAFVCNYSLRESFSDNHLGVRSSNRAIASMQDYVALMGNKVEELSNTMSSIKPYLTDAVYNDDKTVRSLFINACELIQDIGVLHSSIERIIAINLLNDKNATQNDEYHNKAVQ